MSKIIRSVFALMAFVLTYSQAYAQTRSVVAMKEIAEYHMYTEHATLVMEEGDIMVFNNEQDEGFVVLSTNPEMPEVLGFSDKGTFNADSIPSNMRFWMDCINQTSEAVSLGLISAQQAFATASTAGTDISPLLGGIMWDQGEPYNLLCPKVDGKTSVTGCGATALAQLMMYYKYPVVGKDNISYEWKKKGEAVPTSIAYDFTKTTFDWANMRNSYTAQYVKDLTGINTATGQITFTGIEGYTTYNGVMLLVDTLFNNSSQDFQGDVTFLLYDSNNKFLEASSQVVTISEALGKGWMWGSTQYIKGKYVMPLTFAMPNTYADGTYRIYLGCKSSRATTWSKCVAYQNRCPNYVEVVKKGQLFSVCGITADCSYSQAEAKAVSELMYACGAALKTNYDPDGSSVSISEPFYGSVDYFGYDKDIFIAGEEYLSTQMKNEIIVEELEAGRPVYLGGATEPNSNGEQAGHAFIADGVRYDTQSTPWIHINWGWNGHANGYFLITSLAPNGTGAGATDGDDFAYQLYIIGGFQPENNKYDGTAIVYDGLTCNTTKIDRGGSFRLSLSSLFNMSANTISGTIKVFLKGEDKEYECGTLVDFSNKELKSRSGWRWDEGSYDDFIVPATVPDGKYKIVLHAENNQSKGIYGKYITKQTPEITVGNPTAIDQIKADSTRKERLFDLLGRPASDKSKGIVVTGNGSKKLMKN